MSGTQDLKRSFDGDAIDSAPAVSTRFDATFTASRLVLARERRGLTRKELAARVRVTPDAITKYEQESCTPSSETLQRCSFALGFPIDWFTAPEISLLDPQSLSFRARRSMSSGLRNKATRAGDLAISVIMPELRRRFNLPPVALPDLSQHTPEEAAILLRHEWKLGQGPISNMVHLLETKGVGIFWLNEDEPSLDAWSLWHDQWPIVMLNTRSEAGCRARFDAAHELGHLVLHRGETVLEGLEVENQANCFASAFLLPEEQFRAESPRYPILQSFFPLKRRWGVSLAAMVMRSKQIGIFSDWNARRAFKEIASNGWKIREPEEIAIARETSRLQTMIGDRLRAKKVDEAQLARDLHIVKADLLELMPCLAAAVEKPVEVAPPKKKAPNRRKQTLPKRVVLRLVPGERAEFESDGDQEFGEQGMEVPRLRLMN